MSAQILPFAASTTAVASPIGCDLRIGEAHGKPADLHAASRFPAYRAFQAMDRLQAVADRKREHYFLNGPMTAADRRARQIKALKPPMAEAAKRGIDATKLMSRWNEQSRRLIWR